VREDEPLEALELGARIEPKLVGEQLARGAVELQRIGLATGAVEGKHEEGAQTLLERVRRHERFQLADELRVAPELEVDLDPLQQRREAQLVQPLGLAGGKPFEAKVGERRSAPDLERLSQELRAEQRRPGRPSLGDEPVELQRVELARLHAHEVAGRAGDDPRRPEQLAQRRDVALHQLVRTGRRLVAPELVDETLARDRLVRVQEQHAEQGALLRSAEFDLPLAVVDLEWTKYRELHLLLSSAEGPDGNA
jgi:hypothetical protein